MYKIIGADQKEYGPISAEQIRQWISEGRVNAQTQACLEGTQDWKPLGMFPEFGFTTSPLAGSLPSRESAPVSTEQILAGDYSLDIGRCMSRGWELFMTHFGALAVAALLIGVIYFVAGSMMGMVSIGMGLNRLPFDQQQYLNAGTSLIIKAILVAPLMGGLYYICLSVIRHQAGEIGDLFAGFKSYFSDLFLSKLVTGLFFAACLLPFTIIYAQRMAPVMEQLKQTRPSPGNPLELLLNMFSQMFAAFEPTLPILLACMIPITYLSVNWVFTIPLIVDKQMGFWTAMRTSWKMVHKHWFHVFGLAVLVDIINIVGASACCVGLLVTVPFTAAVLMFAYEDIFGRKTA